MYSEKLTETYEEWMAKVLDEKKGYMGIKSTKKSMVLLVGKTVEPIISLYVSIRKEDGTEKKLTYDIRQNATSQPIEDFNLLLKDRERMIFHHGEWVQGFGFLTSEYKNDLLMKHGEVTNVFVYCRTPQYHTFIFADRDVEILWQAVKVIEEFAPIDGQKCFLPDAVTHSMDGLWGMELQKECKEVAEHA